MPDKTEDKFPLREDPEHEHIWDKWYPLDNMHKRRVCLHPKCRLIEQKKVV